MAVPVKISANPPNTLQGIATSNQGSAAKAHGPFEVGSALYLALSEDQGGGDFQMQMWKSTDSGATWSEQDAGNGPHFLGWYSSILNGTVIELVYCNLPPGLLRRTTYQEFDTATDTWGAQNQASNTTDVNGDIHCTKLSSGDYLCFYLGSTAAYSIRFSSGTWGTANSEFALSGLSWQGLDLASDSSDTGYFVYRERDFSSVVTLKMRSLTLGGTLSSEFVVSVGSAGATFITGPCSVWNGGLVIPTTYDEAGFPQASAGAPGFFFGTPLASPAWTFKVSGMTTPQPFLMLFLVIDATHSIVFWTTVTSGDTNVWSATYDGSSFGTATLFYDWDANPPAGGGVVPAGDQLLKQPTIAAVTGGYGMAIAIEYNYPAEDYSTFYLAAGILSGYQNKVY